MSMDLYITPEAHEYTWKCIDAVKTEIGGFGFITKEADGLFVWHESFLVPQEVSTASVDYDDESFAYAIGKAAERGFLDDPDFSWMMWHSHCHMGVYWSATDEKDQVEMMRDMSGVSHLFSFVGNHKHDYTIRLDIFDHPLVPHITMEDLAYTLLTNGQISSKVKEDIKELVVQHKPKPWKGSAQGGNGTQTNRTPQISEQEKKQLSSGEEMSIDEWDPKDRESCADFWDCEERDLVFEEEWGGWYPQEMTIMSAEQLADEIRHDEAEAKVAARGQA